MKYKEFKAEAEKLGLRIARRSGEDYVVAGGGFDWPIASISRLDPCHLDTMNLYGRMLNEEYFRQVFHILVKFAQTSIKERRYEEDS